MTRAEGDLSGINVAADGSFYAANEFAITDYGGSWGTEIAHFNTGGTLSLSSVNAPPSATEGISTPFTVAVFTDSNPSETAADFSVTVNWGDGTTSTFTGGTICVSDGNGQYELVAGHAWADDASGLVLFIQIQDSTGISTGGSSSSFKVADAPWSITAVTAPPKGMTEGQNTGTFTVATFTDLDTFSPVTDFTAIIKWGDGATPTITSTNGLSGSGGGSFAVQASHVFDEINTPTVISVKIKDEGGASITSVSSTFTIADAPLTITGISAPPGGFTEGKNTGLFVVATFIDGDTSGLGDGFQSDRQLGRWHYLHPHQHHRHQRLGRQFFCTDLAHFRGCDHHSHLPVGADPRRGG